MNQNEQQVPLANLIEISCSREDLVYMTKLAEQANRFDDMVVNIRKIVELGITLSVEERNLLSVAYRNKIGEYRGALRVLSSIENKEEANPNSFNNLNLIRTYKKKTQEELNRYYNQVLHLIDSYLIQGATNAEATVFFLKMRGDYYRYITEFTQDDEHQKAVDQALEAYNCASNIAIGELDTTNLVRLGLALNFSVFYYEVLNDVAKACQLAQSAFDKAHATIEQREEQYYGKKDPIQNMMQLIGDNITLWMQELEEKNKNL